MPGQCGAETGIPLLFCGHSNSKAIEEMRKEKAIEYKVESASDCSKLARQEFLMLSAKG